MTSYTLPIPELKRLEPILEELFGYRRAMFENELLNVYRTKYPNGISKEVANNYMIACPFLNEIAVDNGAFNYHRYAPRPASTSMELDVKNFIMDTEHEITIVLSNDTILKHRQIVAGLWREGQQRNNQNNSSYRSCHLRQACKRGTLHRNYHV